MSHSENDLPLRVLALTPHPIESPPGHRFRLVLWARLLEERGIRLTYVLFASPALGRILYQRKRRLGKAARSRPIGASRRARVRRPASIASMSSAKRRSSNTEIVLRGENGLVADGIADWPAKLRWLLGDPDLRKRLGERSRRTAVESYSPRAVLSRVVEIFQKAKEGSATTGA